MLHISNLLLVGLLLINLTGLALLTYRFAGAWLLARAASPLLIAVPFFLEHFIGFGSLTWLWPIVTGASAWLIARQRRVLWENRHTEAVYYVAFAYAFAWRYCFPDITASSEKLTDLSFVADYLPGVRLPPPDRWLPPSPFDMYYALQHYGAALAGRLFGLSAGQAYSFAFCLIIASCVTAAAGAAWLFVRRRGAAALLAAAFLVGGTGAAPVIRWVMAPNWLQLHSSTRFMGSSLSPDTATGPLGQWLIRTSHLSNNSLDLPVEMFSYLVALGDFHPPLGGFLLLTVALLSIALIEAGEAYRPAHAVLAATVPLTIATNAWDLPIQAFLAGAYLACRVWARKPVPWKAVAAGAAAGAVLVQPFLAHLVSHSGDTNLAIRVVPKLAHAPLLPGLLVFYPILALLALHLLCGERTRPSLMFCAIWILLLAASEFLFVDDIYGGKFERFNTVLKWWSWIYAGTTLIIGALNLRSPSRLCRWGTVAVLLIMCVYARDLGANLLFVPKTHLGQLDGDGWIRDDPASRAVLEFLAGQPPCVVLQRVTGAGYVSEPALVMFAGQTPFLGWGNHENVWRGYRVDIDRRMEQVQTFFRGDLPDSARWLEQHRIRYVLWLKDDNKLPKGTFEKINDQIRDRYFWREFYVAGDFRVGIWSLNQP